MRGPPGLSDQVRRAESTNSGQQRERSRTGTKGPEAARGKGTNGPKDQGIESVCVRVDPWLPHRRAFPLSITPNRALNRSSGSSGRRTARLLIRAISEIRGQKSRSPSAGPLAFTQAASSAASGRSYIGHSIFVESLRLPHREATKAFLTNTEPWNGNTRQYEGRVRSFRLVSVIRGVSDENNPLLAGCAEGGLPGA